MNDVHRVVDEIRFLIQAGEASRLEEMRELASQYSAACRDVNARLRTCRDLLRRGLQSEAVRHIEIEPILLDMVASLDFEEREEWAAVCREFDLEVPQGFLMEVAEDLNALYSNANPIESKLKRLRLLNLSGASLADRIRVLRELSGVDGSNPVWQEDLRVFEKALVEELAASAKDAKRRGDLGRLREIGRDLAAGNLFVEKIPTRLIERVSQWTQEVHLSTAQRDLPAVIDELSEACAEFDVDRARGARRRFLDYSSAIGLAGDDELAQQAEPALAWLEEQDRRAARDEEQADALVELEQALDDASPSLEKLERLRVLASTDGLPLPGEIDGRYQGVTRRLRKSARLRLASISLASIAVLLGVGALVIYLISSYQRESDKALYANEVEQLVAAGSFAAAREVLAQRTELEPEGESSTTLELKDLIEKSELAEALRKMQLEEAFEQIAADTSPEEVESARAKARSLSNKPAEVARIQKRFADVQAAWKERKETALREFTDRLTALDPKTRLDRIDLLLKENLDVAAAEHRVFRDALLALSELAQPGSKQERMLSDHRTRLDGLSTELTRSQVEAREEKELREREASWKSRLTKAVGDPVEYGKALEGYLEAFPWEGFPHTRELSRVLEERASWEVAVRAGKLMDGWKRSKHVFPIERLAAQRKRDCEKLLEARPESCESVFLSEYRDACDAILARTSGVDTYKKRLRDLLQHRDLFDVWLVRVKERDEAVNYYALGKPETFAAKREGIEVNFRRFKGIFGPGLKDTALKSFPVGELESVELSPQSRWAKGARQLVADMTEEKWEETLITILRSLRSETRVDPILRVILLKYFVQFAMRSSFPLKKHLLPFWEGPLVESTINTNVAWQDPRNSSVRMTRKKALELLETLPSLKSLSEDVAREIRRFESLVDARRTWVGRLAKDPAGAWSCSLRSGLKAIEADVSLWVVVPAGTRDTWRRIGELSDGVSRLRENLDERDLVLGRPVFFAPAEN